MAWGLQVSRDPRPTRDPDAWTLPSLLIAGYVALLPIQFEPGTLGLPLRFAPSDALLLAYLAVRLPRLRHVGSAWSVWMMALPALLGTGMLVALINTGHVGEYAYLQKGVGLLTLMAAFLALVDHLDSWDRIHRVVRIFVISVLVNAVVSVVCYVLAATGGPIVPVLNQPFPGVRLTGMLIDPNAFGGLIGIALLLHLLTATGARPALTGVLRRTADVFLPVALLLTFSRSSWIGFVCGLLVVTALRPAACAPALRRMAAGAVVALPAAVIGLALVVSNPLSLIERPDQVQSRLSIGSDALAEIEHSPLLGVGIGVYQERHGVIVHNTALWFATELGVIGLIVFAGLIWSVCARLFVLSRAAAPANAALATALLAANVAMLGLSIGIEAFYQRHWWLLFAVAGAAWALERDAATRVGPGALVRTAG